ncbi:MAG: ATP-binding protein [Bacteroidales bacterium]|nr:ATP-binding protein [Bacteroidales bacterium]
MKRNRDTDNEVSQLYTLISGGESQTLDFKFAITDSKKIAKSLSAFANTDGGSLLIGVKDNGVIAGTDGDEEYYMIETAAQIYCRPEVRFSAHLINVGEKNVLKIDIPKGKSRPYCAKDNNDKWLAYVRVKDENVCADRIIFQSWKNQNSSKSLAIKYRRHQDFVMKYLEEKNKISVQEVSKYLELKRYEAENVLISLMTASVIEPIFDFKPQIFYVLKNNL